MRTVPVFTAVSPSGVEQPPRLVTVTTRIKAFTIRSATCLESNALPPSPSEHVKDAQPAGAFVWGCYRRALVSGLMADPVRKATRRHRGGTDQRSDEAFQFWRVATVIFPSASLGPYR